VSSGLPLLRGIGPSGGWCGSGVERSIGGWFAVCACRRTNVVSRPISTPATRSWRTPAVAKAPVTLSWFVSCPWSIRRCWSCRLGGRGEVIAESRRLSAQRETLRSVHPSRRSRSKVAVATSLPMVS
jgi:hypothetical protein